jgi:hypothetical protein
VAKAYVETTVLADALLKPGARAKSAITAIKTFEESQLPVYAIKEMKAGPLHHYVWLHGKLVTTRSWAKTLEQLRKMAMTPRRYWVSTAVEALEAAAHSERSVTLGDLVERYGRIATDDVVRCDRYRLALRNIVVSAWRRRHRLTSSVVDPLPCYAETEICEERGLIELGETKCQPTVECALAAPLKANPEALKKLRVAVEAQPDKPENKKRGKVLKDLVRVPKEKLTPVQCRQLGDAVFAFFCPDAATILTTNTKDLRPLADALGKKAQSPIETT